MATKDKGGRKGHICPPIPEGFTKKMTGPAWNGESHTKARAMWYQWLRDLDAHAKPMPRRTSK